MRWPKALLDALDQATRLLPVVVVGALAAYTWWLVQSTPFLGSGRGMKAPPTVPDYVLGHATIERFDAEGRRLSILHGEKMSHVVVGDLLTVEQPRLVGLDPRGQHLDGTAQLGHYAATDDLADLQGQAHVVIRGGSSGRSPLVFDGETLSVNVRQRSLKSDTPVMLTTNNGVVHGQTLRHDSQTGITDLGGRVHGQMAARPR